MNDIFPVKHELGVADSLAIWCWFRFLSPLQCIHCFCFVCCSFSWLKTLAEKLSPAGSFLRDPAGMRSLALDQWGNALRHGDDAAADGLAEAQ
jgi:hypothetical protein